MGCSCWFLVLLLLGQDDNSVPPLSGRPPHFNGAVGRFRVDATVAPDHLRLAETATYRFTVHGTGDVSKLQPPRLQQTPGFRDSFDVVGAPVEKRLVNGKE